MSEVLRKDQSFKGFETWLTSVRMHIKMTLYIIVAIFILQVIVTLTVSYLRHSEEWNLIVQYVYMHIRNFSVPNVSKICKLIKALLRESLAIFIVSFSLYFLYPALYKKFKRRAREQSRDRYVRGARLITADELMKQIKKSGEKTHIKIGNVRMPVTAEVKHMFVVGRPGTGKTVAIRQVVEDIRTRNNKAVIYDFKGDYLCKFYNHNTDIIFNPLDTRCIGWNLFNEIETKMDIDSIATSLIPPASGNADPFWNDGARDVFASILYYLYQNNLRTNADIWGAVTSPGVDIAKWLQNTRGAERGYRYIEDANSKQAMSILAVMMQYVKSFEYLAKTDGEFSIKEWLYNDKGGFIFVTSYADVQDTLRPILSLFIDLISRKLLSMQDDYERRIFFILDEFGTLQRLSTVVKLLTLARSKGGSVWIGIQDVGQIDKLYTQHLRQAIINACGSSLILSVADPDTAKFLSDKIGDREYIETEETHSMGVEDNRDGISLIRRKKTDKLVLASELQNLKDLTGFVKFPGYPLSHVSLQYKSYKDVAQSFICRQELNLNTIATEQSAISEQADIIVESDRQVEVRTKTDSKQSADKNKQEQHKEDNTSIEVDMLEL